MVFLVMDKKAPSRLGGETILGLKGMGGIVCVNTRLILPIWLEIGLTLVGLRPMMALATAPRISRASIRRVSASPRGALRCTVSLASVVVDLTPSPSALVAHSP